MATMIEDVSIAGGVRGTLTEAAGPAPYPCVVMLHAFGGHRNEVGGLFAKLAPVEAVADYDDDLFVAAGGLDRLVKHVGTICAAARRARSCEQRVIDGADRFFNALDPTGGYIEPLLAHTADFFARTLRGG